MAYLDTHDAPTPRISPELMVGVASPLWSYFGAVAAGGVAFWWMTQWTRPVNLEAIFAPSTRAVEPTVEPVLEAVEETARADIEATEAALPIVAEAPAVEPAPETDPEPEAALVDATPKAKAKKPASFDSEP